MQWPPKIDLAIRHFAAGLSVAKNNHMLALGVRPLIGQSSSVGE